VEYTSTTNAPAQPVATDKDYDQFVRELAMDKRAQPKDRTKTEEEIALEEKEALELAEKKRLRRMMGEQEESEDETGVRSKRNRGGDDLDDDFILEDDTFEGIGSGLKNGSGEDEDDRDNDEEDETEESSGKEDDAENSGEPSSGEDSENYGPSDEGEEAEEGSLEEIAPTRTKKAKKFSKKQTELPFTFPCPSTHAGFLDIVENVNDSLVGTVVERIRKLHHPSLHAENKFRLQVRSIPLLESPFSFHDLDLCWGNTGSSYLFS
jgi:nucleolar protein 14